MDPSKKMTLVIGEPGHTGRRSHKNTFRKPLAEATFTMDEKGRYTIDTAEANPLPLEIKDVTVTIDHDLLPEPFERSCEVCGIVPEDGARLWMCKACEHVRYCVRLDGFHLRQRADDLASERCMPKSRLEGTQAGLPSASIRQRKVDRG